jgi:iron complex outermembrane receptor protein
MRFVPLAGVVGLSFCVSVSAQEVAKPLPQVRVIGTPDEVDASTAPKSGLSLIETPQAISIVTAQTIEDRGITRLTDALRGVAGVSRSSTYGFYDAYSIRGYDAAYNSIFLDGLTMTNAAGTNNELAGLEQVEVIKGAASALYGAAPLGGIVNLVSKRPRADSFFDVGLATGSYGNVEARVDANAPLTESGSLLGRLNLLYRDTDDFENFSGENRIYVAPALTWNIAEATHLTFLGRYQRDHDNPWSPLIAYGTVLPAAFGELPIDFSINRRGDYRAIQNQERKQIGYAFQQDFGPTLRFEQNLRYGHTYTYWNNWLFSDELLDSNFVDGVQQGHLWGLNVYGPFRQTNNDFTVDNRLHWRAEIGSVTHGVMVGFDFKRTAERHAEDGGNYDMTVNTMDVLAPDYSAPLIHDPAAAYSDSAKSKQKGYYIQDHIGFGEKFFLTLNGRWDDVLSDGIRDHAFSPNAGINYFLTPSLAVYANWSKSFTPQFGWVTDVDGNILPPERGRNVEAGVKFGDASRPFTAQIALFQLTRQNVANSDPENPLFYVVTGEQRSRGLEIEGGWSPREAWKFGWAYSYIDAVITRDEVFATGVQLSNVPRHNLFLSAQYEVQSGPLSHLRVGLEALYNSRRNSSLSPYDYNGDGVDDPAIPLPSYSLADLVVSYPVQGWDAQLSVDNVFDERYYPDAGYYTRITPGAPRSWRFALARKF